MLTVVNVKGLMPNDPSVIYLGRWAGGWKGSPLYNPFSHLHYSHATYTTLTREQSIECFRHYFWAAIQGKNQVSLPYEVEMKTKKVKKIEIKLTKQDILDLFQKIQPDMKLGCWCAPLSCHAEAIKSAWEKWKVGSLTF